MSYVTSAPGRTEFTHGRSVICMPCGVGMTTILSGLLILNPASVDSILPISSSPVVSLR
jgi:hypothetical protein